jgi:hypothetical protein
MEACMVFFFDMDIYKLAAYIYITHIAPSVMWQNQELETHMDRPRPAAVDTASACEEKGNTS